MCTHKDVTETTMTNNNKKKTLRRREERERRRENGVSDKTYRPITYNDKQQQFTAYTIGDKSA